MRLQRMLPMLGFVRRVNMDNYSKSTALFLNDAQNAPLMIDSFCRNGFRLNNNMQTFGSLIIFPKTVLSWNVRHVSEINEDSLTLFHMLEPKVDILVLGIGDQGSRVNSNTLIYMNRKGVSVEVLPTEQACATYNFLVSEGRFVAGAFIPPSQVELSEGETISENIEKARLTEDW